MHSGGAALLGLYSPDAVARPDPDRLVRMNMALVRKIAWHTHARVSSALDIEELVQTGMVALIEAARTFEDRGQAAFSTYASVRIRGAMIDLLRKQATLCRSALRKRRELGAAQSRLNNRLGRAPSHAELAEEMGLELPDLHDLLNATQAVRHESMDEVYSDHSIWFAAEEPDALEQLQSSRMRKAIADSIRNLPQREAQVLQLYFVEELNLEEIGQVLGVGAARVCQIKKVALDKLRNHLGGWDQD
ncbi:FliA/WhiG family RNA polymerase sigma factor [Sandaracinobacter neustonicus]|uniref:FliA/WhiG family RNA polymerase sigma factor n=2 Tax=Sandaracinobacter neustonicus TaxID=1715348 RepID=A0A501XF44_9SPHN|nr:FliA/WhiG family RNA polymerase sigma factor [Sandaracinobacter neustonicus]